MIYWIIGIIVYLAIAGFTYNKFVSKWDNKKWEKILFSLFWVGILPLYGVRKIHENI